MGARQSLESKQMIQYWMNGMSVKDACLKSGISISTGYRNVMGKKRPKKKKTAKVVDTPS
jgi:transposase